MNQTEPPRAILRFDARGTERYSNDELLQLPTIDGEEILDALLERGIQFLATTWLDFDPTTLAAEDDALFLVDSWHEALELVRGLRKEHETYLGDGALVMTATATATGEVRLECTHTPHLQASLRKSESRTMTLEQYERAWRALMRDLLTAAGRDGESTPSS